MLRSIDTLRDYDILATDGQLGSVYDFFFDDESWTVRYLVVDTGNWLPGRRVLVSPYAIRQPNWAEETLPVNLTKEQVENSPHMDMDKPVSREKEIALTQYYGWPDYWNRYPMSATGMGGTVIPASEGKPNALSGATPPAPEENLSDEEEVMKAKSTYDDVQESRTLRSTKEVEGYDIQATDDNIGHVQDFLVDDENWMIRYLVVDTRNWLPGGKKVLISPAWAKYIYWRDSDVAVSLTKEQIKNSPEYDPDSVINRAYETVLYEHYDKEKYWEVREQQRV